MISERRARASIAAAIRGAAPVRKLVEKGPDHRRETGERSHGDSRDTGRTRPRASSVGRRRDVEARRGDQTCRAFTACSSMRRPRPDSPAPWRGSPCGFGGRSGDGEVQGTTHRTDGTAHPAEPPPRMFPFVPPIPVATLGRPSRLPPVIVPRERREYGGYRAYGGVWGRSETDRRRIRTAIEPYRDRRCGRHAREKVACVARRGDCSRPRLSPSAE